MNRATYAIEISFVSGVVAIVKTFFGTIDTSYIILLVLITLDTITGMSAAFKYKRFSSRGLCKLIKKTITYTIAIITVTLLEVGAFALVDTNFLSQVLVAFLQVTEAISILENLTVLGVPLPKNFIAFLLKNIQIPGLSTALQMSRSDEKDISEINNIINYHLPTLNDKYIEDLLTIKLNFWRKMILNVSNIFEDRTSNDKNHLYYKMMSIMEIELKDMNRLIEKANIAEGYINIFETFYRNQVDRWLNRVKNICFSNTTNDDKKNKVINSIVALCYATMLNTHRTFNH